MIRSLTLTATVMSSLAFASAAQADVFVNLKTHQCGWFATERNLQRELDIEIASPDWYAVALRDGASMAPRDRNDENTCRRILDESGYDLPEAPQGLRGPAPKPCEVLHHGLRYDDENRLSETAYLRFIEAYCGQMRDSTGRQLTYVARIPTRRKLSWYEKPEPYAVVGGLAVASVLAYAAYLFDKRRNEQAR